MSQNPYGPPPQAAPTFPSPGAPVGSTASPASPPARLTLALLIVALLPLLGQLLSMVAGFLIGVVIGAAPGGYPSDGVTVLSLGTRLFGALVFIAQVALLVLAILVVVRGRGRVRTGGIVVIAALVLGIGQSIVFFIVRLAVARADFESIRSMSTAYSVVSLLDFLIAVLLSAAAIVGAVIAWRASRAAAPSAAPAPPSSPAPPASPAPGGPLRPLG